MIKLTFTAKSEVMNFYIKDREIFYQDKVWHYGIRCIPKDEEFIKKVRESRNKLPDKLLTMFKLTEKQQKEYDDAKTDEEIVEIIIKDCKSQGLTLLKRKDD